MAGYVFQHEGRQYDPNGRVHVNDVVEHNRQIEAAELAFIATKPETFIAYEGKPSPGDCYTVTTWLGTKIGEIVRYRDYLDGFGHRMRSVRVKCTNGAMYHGKFGYDWSQAIRLRRFK